MAATPIAGVPREGDEIPPFARRTGFANWNRYAAVNDEFVPMHMDDEAGRAAGMPGAFGMGNLQLAYLHNLLRQWVGPDGAIVSVSCRFRAPNTKDMRVTARGRVVKVSEEDGRVLVDLDVWTEDEGGRRLAPGTARVMLADA
ncbi:acyl dehydratase [Thermocatellispora tengchongensis]|uniref:Acyl dehydratase n=1 Tax=Thermocatellispora tengchongensis TaxID=1073253 RepID=A0A840PIJ0_9ACTN|nr:MaoC/PaaZ C-terminal domain-containing protein [Thermocatellispora tengchongensis]MBB5137370.1 acyl dehydratase [Thermocatellispora tengchongensis]